MKVERSRHQNALAVKKLQQNLAAQLHRVQLKLQQECIRSGTEYSKSVEKSSKSIFPSNAVRHKNVATSPQPSQDQIQNKWMEDIDSVINHLRDEVERLRTDNELVKGMNHNFRSEIEKLRNEKEIAAASFLLKIAQCEAQVSTKLLFLVLILIHFLFRCLDWKKKSRVSHNQTREFHPP